jgi:ABC-type microcin C transport system permease subunit YejB
MNSELTLNERNKLAVMLMQALWGAISSNFRMVALYPCGPVQKLRFVLERDSVADREEIEDVIAEFDALQETGASKFEVETIITAESLEWPEPPWLVVFRRRES